MAVLDQWKDPDVVSRLRAVCAKCVLYYAGLVKEADTPPIKQLAFMDMLKSTNRPKAVISTTCPEVYQVNRQLLL